MSSFIDDTIPPLEIRRDRLVEILVEIANLWPKEVVCTNKFYGLDNYTCRDLTKISRDVRDRFENIDWRGDIEVAGVAMDFVGLAVKNASRYLRKLRLAELDFDMIISNIEARDDILVRAS